jgi:hypothetical protein
MKTNKKNQRNYGLSVIIDIGKCSDSIYNMVSSIIDTITFSDDILHLFVIQNHCHLTLLRCKSTDVDFDINTETIETFKNMFNNKEVFNISSKAIRIDEDGVIRLHFDKVPSCLYNSINVLKLSELTGFKYQIIYQPWLTLCYTKLEYISTLISNFELISNKINGKPIKLDVAVDTISLVKYYDTAFRNIEIVSSIRLGGKDD